MKKARENIFVLGIDDAGRGPVIGPMVLAGVLATKKEIAKLMAIGVKDSKMLSPKRRAFLFQKIKKIATANCILKAWPQEIDEKIARKINLNKVEALKIAKIINILTKGIKSTEVIVDCPSPNIKAWQNYLFDHILEKNKIKLRCEHKADVNYPIVGAASILAKVTRDKEIERIKTRYGASCGSGYPSDPLCQKFLKTSQAKELAKNGLIRKSWITWQREEKKKGQRKLVDF